VKQGFCVQQLMVPPVANENVKIMLEIARPQEFIFNLSYKCCIYIPVSFGVFLCLSIGK